MSIKGIGVDIEAVGRFRKLSYKSNQSFYKKIFTPTEVKYCLSKADPYPHFAARFAAKEAVIKALGSSMFKVNQIEVVNDKYGKPSIKFPISNFQFPKGKIKLQVLISMSHTKDHAVAIALVTKP